MEECKWRCYAKGVVGGSGAGFFTAATCHVFAFDLIDGLGGCVFPFAKPLPPVVFGNFDLGSSVLQKLHNKFVTGGVLLETEFWATRKKLLDVNASRNSKQKVGLKSDMIFNVKPSSNGQMLDYNVPGGKLNRGLSVVDSYQLLKGGELIDDEVFLASALGWCIEWL
ncbi:hypothetical protein L1987_69326 [Smallanthus sonchifolius]|uniref:Uncharacterized protein n=1 Tax=Smallanthus sonchifolius TaxID=185202 RepID=A0ACB9B708_9ASTR|nr:hypothetical protein L1987_69326 [Smallanthus sonchifolius]